MIRKIVDKCPDEFKDKLSPDLMSRAVGYALFLRAGKPYCVPVTDSIKKGFGLKVRGGKYEQEDAIIKAIADITSAVYLQVRETVGEEVKSHLSRLLVDRIEEAIYPQIDKKVDQEMQKLIEGDEEAQ